MHIGSARTALFTWMWARKHGGRFILRIEDTDQARYNPESLQEFMTTLRWLGIEWDEGPEVGGDYGPYIQSERTELYRKWGNWLLENGHAYKDFTTKEELEAMRAKQQAEGLPFGYDGRHRELSAAQIADFEAQGLKPTIRFKAPLDGTTTFYDEMRGELTIDNKQIQDNVLMKSDGFPTYHLANVVDDHFMQITHITRGVEWLGTAPLHVNLYKAFGWEMPKIAHLPVILKLEGSGKMSKRDKGALVREYIDNGYLSTAVVNYLSNIGWSFGDDVEKFTTAAALPRFELKDLNPAPAKLPLEKLDWLNGQYIQELDDEALVAGMLPFAQQVVPEIDPAVLHLLAPAMSKRMKAFSDVLPVKDDDGNITKPSPLAFLIDERWSPDPARLSHKKMGAVAAAAAFKQARQFMAAQNYDVDSLAAALSAIGEGSTDNGKAGPFLGTMRYGITGQPVSPPLFESIMALGNVTALDRLEKMITLLQNRPEQ